MAINDDQYNRMLDRIGQLEEMMNDFVTVLNKASTAASIGKVITIFETELDDIKNRISTLETSVSNLENLEED